MAEFVTVGDSAEVPEGEAKAFDVSGAEIAVARVEGQLYAFSDICTHRHCNLANGGEIDGTTIECECHGSQFDMKTGARHGPWSALMKSVVTSMSVQDMAAFSAFAASTPAPVPPTTSTAAR